mgnify:CR=1 FL=1
MQFSIQEFNLPSCISDSIKRQNSCPFGVALLEFRDCCIGIEVCEELFAGENRISDISFANGAQIIMNASASAFECGKLSGKLELVKEVAKKNGGFYVYCNANGCDGERILFDGCGFCIAKKGELLCIRKQIRWKHVD